jgi:hypothetical protein
VNFTLSNVTLEHFHFWIAFIVGGTKMFGWANPINAWAHSFAFVQLTETDYKRNNLINYFVIVYRVKRRKPKLK